VSHIGKLTPYAGLTMRSGGTRITGMWSHRSSPGHGATPAASTPSDGWGASHRGGGWRSTRSARRAAIVKGSCHINGKMDANARPLLHHRWSDLVGVLGFLYGQPLSNYFSFFIF
jgi:hypothetical protein